MAEVLREAEPGIPVSRPLEENVNPLAGNQSHSLIVVVLPFTSWPMLAPLAMLPIVCAVYGT